VPLKENETLYSKRSHAFITATIDGLMFFVRIQKQDAVSKIYIIQASANDKYPVCMHIRSFVRSFVVNLLLVCFLSKSPTIRSPECAPEKTRHSKNE